MLKQRIGFLGAGQMAQALAAGFVQAGLVEPGAIRAYDPSAPARDGFLRRVPGAHLEVSNRAVRDQCDLLILAVKPQAVPAVLAEIQPLEAREKLLVSIAAGISLAALIAGSGSERVVRVMPNTPCLIGSGAACYCGGPGISAQDGPLVATLLGAVGGAWPVDEKLLDAVTGLSGSGPAFVYAIIEGLSDGGVRVGLPRDLATRLAAQTVLGAARMVLETGEHPGVLKDRVASPGGTTIAGLHVIEQHAVRGAMMSAVEAATRRAVELGTSSSAKGQAEKQTP